MGCKGQLVGGPCEQSQLLCAAYGARLRVYVRGLMFAYAFHIDARSSCLRYRLYFKVPTKQLSPTE